MQIEQMRKEKGGVVAQKSKAYAKASLKVGCEIQRTHKEYVASNQWMRSSTSIGANVVESQEAVSKRDFIYKLAIAQKECSESIYWLELLYECDLIEEDQFRTLEYKARELIRILTSIIKTTKRKLDN